MAIRQGLQAGENPGQVIDRILAAHRAARSQDAPRYGRIHVASGLEIVGESIRVRFLGHDVTQGNQP